RLSNCVVSAQPLTIKEQWMSEIFERFTDEKHRLAMVKFLDRISCVGGENSISGDSVSVLKEGWIMERFAREKRCLKLNWMLHKRRYVVLTETELYWAKAKTEQAMGRLILSEVNLIEPVDESTFPGKHIFRIASAANSIYLQASNGVEMSDWLAAIQKQCRRQLMVARQTTQLSQLYDVEIDRELEAVHMSFLEHAETLKHWNNAMEGSLAIPEGESPLPAMLSDSSEEDVPESSTAQSAIRERFSKSLQSVLLGTMVLEKAHRDAVFRYLKQMRYGSIDNPIGDDNYLLLKSRMKDLTPDGAGV
uniref:PH domain-containing protein n=1 Tax=Plectus sambesii TaxID=2011161 RepID=A0A914WMZ1_9BILA